MLLNKLLLLKSINLWSKLNQINKKSTNSTPLLCAIPYKITYLNIYPGTDLTVQSKQRNWYVVSRQLYVCVVISKCIQLGGGKQICQDHRKQDHLGRHSTRTENILSCQLRPGTVINLSSGSKTLQFHHKQDD